MSYRFYIDEYKKNEGKPDELFSFVGVLIPENIYPELVKKIKDLQTLIFPITSFDSEALPFIHFSEMNKSYVEKEYQTRNLNINEKELIRISENTRQKIAELFTFLNSLTYSSKVRVFCAIRAKNFPRDISFMPSAALDENANKEHYLQLRKIKNWEWCLKNLIFSLARNFEMNNPTFNGKKVEVFMDAFTQEKGKNKIKIKNIKNVFSEITNTEIKVNFLTEPNNKRMVAKPQEFIRSDLHFYPKEKQVRGLEFVDLISRKATGHTLLELANNEFNLDNKTKSLGLNWKLLEFYRKAINEALSPDCCTIEYKNLKTGEKRFSIPPEDLYSFQVSFKFTKDLKKNRLRNWKFEEIDPSNFINSSWVTQKKKNVGIFINHKPV